MDATPSTRGGTGEVVITPQDILFECPECSKSMVADQSAEGQIVECPQCLISVIVPAKARTTLVPAPNNSLSLALPATPAVDTASVKQILSRIADADKPTRIGMADLLLAEQQINAVAVSELQRSRGQQAELAGHVKTLQQELAEARAKAPQFAQLEQRLQETTRLAVQLASQQAVLKEQLTAAEQALVEQHRQRTEREGAAQQRIDQSELQVRHLTTELAVLRTQLHTELTERLRQADEFGKAQAMQDALVGEREKRFEQLTQEMDRLRVELARTVEHHTEAERRLADRGQTEVQRLTAELAEARAELQRMAAGKTDQPKVAEGGGSPVVEVGRRDVEVTAPTAAASLGKLEPPVGALANAAPPLENAKPLGVEGLHLTQSAPEHTSRLKLIQQETDRAHQRQAALIAEQFSHLRRAIVEKKSDAERESAARKWANRLRQFFK